MPQLILLRVPAAGDRSVRGSARNSLSGRVTSSQKSAPGPSSDPCRPYSTIQTSVPTPTSSNKAITSALRMRTQPWDAGCPISPSSFVPWM